MSKNSKKPKSKQRQDEEKLLYLALTFFLGPAVIGASLWTLNFVGVGAGVFLEAWGIWGLPEIHPYLKVIINWKSRKQNAKITKSPNSQILQAQRDIVVVNPPSQPVSDPSQPKINPGLRVGFEMYGTTPGRKLVWLIASNLGRVPVFLNSIPSFQVKMPDGQFLTPTSENWETDVDFPVELRPGRSVNIWRDLRGFATSMKKNGYSGKLNLIVRCRDEADRIFESGPILFDVDDYAKNA